MAGRLGRIARDDEGADLAEQVRGSWVASIPFKRFDLAKEGGNLVLTEGHLLFRPLRVPLVIGEVFVMTGGRPTWIVSLEEVRAITACPGKRSQLRVETLDGSNRNFIIAARRTASWRNPKNAEARDDAVVRIIEALAS